MNGSSSSPSNRRRFPRIDALYLVSYVSRENDAQVLPIAMGRSVALSAGGIRVEVYQPVQVGCRMEMDIAMHDQPFKVRGTVVHSKPAQEGQHVIGIQFDEAHEDLVGLVKPG
jgi:hypothetical protein